MDQARTVENADLKLLPADKAFRIVALFPEVKVYLSKKYVPLCKGMAIELFQEPESESLARGSASYTTLIWLSHFVWREDSFWQTAK